MATMEEGALDLSTAKVNTEYRSRSPDSPRAKMARYSPVPSLSSDGEGLHRGSVTPGSAERPTSVCSNSRDGSSPLGGTVRPVAGPMPTSFAPTSSMSRTGTNGQANGNISPGLPSSMRPFKMYPFDVGPSSALYGQVASPHATSGIFPGFGASPGGMSPLSPSPASVFDSAISLSSPVTQYLQQRKRRMDSRVSRDAESESSSSQQNSPQTPVKTHVETDIRNVNTDRKVNNVPEERKDDCYWERRRKNNDAAKRSRDARRAKEEEIALRAAYLEQENLKLRAQVAILKNETAKLHYMLYNRI